MAGPHDPEERLRAAVQHLSLSADAALARLPSVVVRADELALNFADGLLSAGVHAGLTDAQRNALGALDGQLEAMSGTENDALWTDDAVRVSAEWASVRRLAGEVLTAFGWPRVPPGDPGHRYIPGS